MLRYAATKGGSARRSATKKTKTSRAFTNLWVSLPITETLVSEMSKDTRRPLTFSAINLLPHRAEWVLWRYSLPIRERKCGRNIEHRGRVVQEKSSKLVQKRFFTIDGDREDGQSAPNGVTACPASDGGCRNTTRPPPHWRNGGGDRPAISSASCCGR